MEMEDIMHTPKNMVKVTFDYNYAGAPKDIVIEVEKGRSIPVFDDKTENTAPDTPVRDGYRFAGWDTSAAPVLEDGYSKTMWPLGDYFLPWSRGVEAALSVEEESMPLNEDVILYARWVKPTFITTPEELFAMREDLSGWYILDNDIDLTGVHWIPVGTYVSHYEYLYSTWWKEAFRGVLDGVGHTVSGLVLDTVSYYKDDESSRKGIRNGVSALFGAVADGGVVQNLNLDRVTIDMESNIHYAYIASLAGMVEDGVLMNCHVTNLSYKTAISDTDNINFSAATTGIYASLSGLFSGVWGGKVENCTVQGTMDIILTSNTAHQGTVFIGSVLGDGYIPLVHCSSDVVINCSYTDQVADIFKEDEEKNNYFSLYCGGNAGLAESLVYCPGKGSISIKDQSKTGNMLVLCQGSYGALVDDEARVLESDYNGVVIK